MSYYREQLENWLKTIDVKCRSVLDVGGGSNPVIKRVKSWDVMNYWILDNEIEKRSEEAADGFLNGDVNKSWLNDRAGDFDAVFCLEVFEYVYDPLTAIKNIAHMMRKGAVAYISFPFVYPQHNPISFDYLRYTPNGVMKLLSEAGFSEIDILERGDRSGLLKQFYSADGMHPAKEQDHSVYGMMVTAIK